VFSGGLGLSGRELCLPYRVGVASGQIGCTSSVAFFDGFAVSISLYPLLYLYLALVSLLLFYIFMTRNSFYFALSPFSFGSIAAA